MLRMMFKAVAGFDAVVGLRLVQWLFKAVARFMAAGADKVYWKYMENKLERKGLTQADARQKGGCWNMAETVI